MVESIRCFYCGRFLPYQFTIMEKIIDVMDNPYHPIHSLDPPDPVWYHIKCKEKEDDV